MNCVIYARVSTQEQAERELSIPAQQQAMREYAGRQSWSILEEFLEPGASARTAERPVLQQLLSRCRRTPKVDVVLVHKIDRLARNVFDHATIRALLKQRGIRLASVVENVDDTISGQLVENIMASIAQFYSSNLGEEVKKGMRVMVARGEWPHKPPRGYVNSRSPEGRPRAVPDPIIAPLVKHAFERYATGLHALWDIGEELRGLGFVTNQGKQLPVSYVQSMLANPFYKGSIHWNGEERKGVHEPIVSEELFGKVQEVMRRRKSYPGLRGKLKFLLKGTAVCGDCGYLMTAERHGDDLAYYRCIRNTRRRGCRVPLSNAARAHGSLVRLYAQMQMSEQMRSVMLGAATADIRAREAEGKRAERSLTMQRVKLVDRQTRLAEGFASGHVAPEVYKALNGKFDSERNGLDKALELARHEPGLEIRHVESVLDLASSLADLHRRLDIDEQRLLLRAVFAQIVLSKGNIVGFTLNPPFDALLGGKEKDVSELSTESVRTAAKLLEHIKLPASIPEAA